MTRKTNRKQLTVALVLLAVAAVATVLALRDPELEAIEIAVQQYVFDIQRGGGGILSAARRIDPDDLVALKMAALEQAGKSVTFRDEATAFFDLKDTSLLSSVSKEQFFSYLVYRTFKTNPEVEKVLVTAEMKGIATKRSGDVGHASVVLEVDTKEGERRFTLNIELLKRDGTWWIRL